MYIPMELFTLQSLQTPVRALWTLPFESTCSELEFISVEFDSVYVLWTSLKFKFIIWSSTAANTINKHKQITEPKIILRLYSLANAVSFLGGGFPQAENITFIAIKTQSTVP